ncbi:ATP-dependent Clp protease proteolytic subunit [Sphingosinithalassobacter sp. LHW66-3]|uniref:ATP-dependent Clp protease proteolytic subunit n=1 Tax=Sphingosinithalassobacter sp. LHW66-3 TaxID=3424718 RepID=UPI003D6C36E8
MAEQQQSLVARLIPGDLERTVPAAMRRALPGGLRNRFVQAGLALLIAVGFAFVVRRMLQRREERRAERRAIERSRPPEALAAQPPSPAASLELSRTGAVATAMNTDQTPAPSGGTPPPPPAPAAGQEAGEDSRAREYPLLAEPHIHLSGTVDHAMYGSFREQLQAAPDEGTLVIAISTLGGDPEVARLMGDEVRLLREYSGREILFLGKVAVYSAGATFMAAFPVEKRFLTKGTRIMIHERVMTSTINLSGPLKTLTATLRAKLHEIEHSVRIEEEGFRDLVRGSKIDFDEVRSRAPENWYISAEEAREKGLVLDVI